MYKKKNIINAMNNTLLNKFIKHDILYQNANNKPIRFAKTKFKKSDLTDEDLKKLLENYAYFLLAGKKLSSMQNDFSNIIFEDFLIKLNEPLVLGDVFVSKTVYNHYIAKYIKTVHPYYVKTYGEHAYIRDLETKNIKYTDLDHIIEISSTMDDRLKKKIEKGLRLDLKRIKDEDLESIKLLFRLI